MSTNYTKEIYDELISEIKTEFVRFKARNRISVVKDFSDINLANLGYDDCIVIHPLEATTNLQLTAGAIVSFPIELLYLKKRYINQIDDVSAFAENLDAHLRSKTHNGDYWYHLATSYDYDIGGYLPDKFGENIKNYSGFLMAVEFLRYKSGSAAAEYKMSALIYTWKAVSLSDVETQQTLTTGSGELTLAKLDSGQSALPTFVSPVTVDVGSKYQERGCQKTTIESISGGNVSFGLTLDEYGENHSDGDCKFDITITAIGNS